MNIWIKFLLGSSGLEGIGTGRTWTQKEVQERIYDLIGVDSASVASSHKNNTITFNEEQLRNMDEDEFDAYFTDDPLLIETPDIDVSKTKSAFVLKDLTFEDYMKKTAPKSSFREANKRMKQIEDENNR